MFVSHGNGLLKYSSCSYPSLIRLIRSSVDAVVMVQRSGRQDNGSATLSLPSL